MYLEVNRQEYIISYLHSSVYVLYKKTFAKENVKKNFKSDKKRGGKKREIKRKLRGSPCWPTPDEMIKSDSQPTRDRWRLLL